MVVLVVLMESLIVVMVSVSLLVTYVMDLLNSVMQDGDLTVLMVQTKDLSLVAMQMSVL